MLENYLLQNQTRTTSFSMPRLLATYWISSDVGFEFCANARSIAMRTVVSIDVRFFLLRPILSAADKLLQYKLLLLMELSASSNHFASKGFNLHMFLNDKFSASNREMVVCEKSLPYIFPIASPTSPWVYPKTYLLIFSVLSGLQYDEIKQRHNS